MPRRPPFLIALIIIAIVAAIGSGVHEWHSWPPAKQPARTGETFSGRARVVDGDSLELAGHRVRLFGVDAPESRQECRDARGRASSPKRSSFFRQSPSGEDERRRGRRNCEEVPASLRDRLSTKTTSNEPEPQGSPVMTIQAFGMRALLLSGNPVPSLLFMASINATILAALS